MPIRGGLPPRNPQFTGREELLAQVRTLLGDGPVVLLPAAGHDLGGTGRGQLAVEYAHRYADTYDLVWWIPAGQPAVTRAALAGLARELDLPESSDLTRTLGAVRDALSRGEPHRNWLVVFDNADRPEDIRPYLLTEEEENAAMARLALNGSGASSSASNISGLNVMRMGSARASPTRPQRRAWA